MGDKSTAQVAQTEAVDEDTAEAFEPGHIYACDRCGERMIESNCKIICLNCGHRFDCSDLNIYFD